MSIVIYSFKGKCKSPETFREDMIAYWIANENSSREEVLKAYGGEDFDGLCEKMLSMYLYFEYYDGDDHASDDCELFEMVDNNFVIPARLIERLSKQEDDVKRVVG